MTVKEIEAAALRLPKKQRERLAEKLMASVIDAPIDPAVERAWVEEAERRLKAYDEGRIRAIPAGEVLRKLRKKLK